MGAMILTNLTLRRPEMLRGAIFHEPPLVAVTSAPAATAKAFDDVVAAGMAAGGPAPRSRCSSGGSQATPRTTPSTPISGPGC